MWEYGFHLKTSAVMKVQLTKMNEREMLIYFINY